MKEDHLLTLQRLQEERKIQSLNKIESENQKQSSMEITRNVVEEKDNSEDKKEIDDEWKEENYVMHAEKKEKETNYVVEVDTSDKDLKNEATPTVKEVQFCKGIKRKVNVEDNYEKEIVDLKDIEKLHKKPRKDKAIRLATALVNESNDDATNINSLPDEAIVEIFKHLEQNQLCQISRVCRRWNLLTRSPVLWKSVNMQFSPSHRSPTAATISLISRLPPYVTSIRLDLAHSHRRLDFEEICVRLQEKCPHLEVLSFTRTKFSRSFSSIIDLCTEFLQDVKKFAFRYCMFSDCPSSTSEGSGISKMEILDVYKCDSDYYGSLNKPPFSRMPFLKELHLYGCYTCDSWFEDDTSFLNQLHVLNLGSTCVTSEIFSAIQNNGHNLKELCLSLSELQDDDLNFKNSVFSQLRTICLKDSEDVTCEGVLSFLLSCQALQNVYVDEDVAKSFQAHPYVVTNKLQSGIVKAIECNHDEEVD